MNQFLRLGWSLYAADTIEHIKECRKGVTVRFKGELTPDVTFENGICNYWDIQTTLTETIIPAQPGFELIISACQRSEEFWFSKHTIIAWRVHCVGVEPITLGDHESDENPQAIQDPFGRVDIPCDRWFESLMEWEEYARDEWAKKRDTVLDKQQAKAKGDLVQ